jgi:hypothetical protein
MALGDAVVKRTFDIDDFSGGLDLRDGYFSTAQNRLRELLNCRINKGRRPTRRPPQRVVQGTLDPVSKGLVSIDGQLYCIARKGDRASGSGDVASTVKVLEFDNPNYATDWTLLHAAVFSDYAVAWIRHTYPSTAYPYIVMLHVWDGLLFSPTYVTDPYLPGSFSPSIADLTDQRYDSTFSPVLGLGVSKLWTSTNRGNTNCCRTADARIWNQRSKDTMLADGESLCWVVPEGQGVWRTFVAARNAEWMNLDQRWAYYVLEYKVGSSWVVMDEASGSPAALGSWIWSASTSRFAGGWNEVGIIVNWPTEAAGLIRLRLVGGGTSVIASGALPTVTTSGAGASRSVNTTTASAYTWRGGDVVSVPATSAFATVTQGSDYLISMGPDGLSSWNLTSQGFPNGWNRERRRIISKITWPGAAPDPTVTDYKYAFEANADSDWYSSLVLEYVDLAGAQDAVGISTSSQDNTGGSITAIACSKNRMVVSYAGSCQLWAIDQATNATTFLESLNFGTGEQEYPSPISFYGSILTPTERGFRAISVAGANLDSLQDSNVGEPIDRLPVMQVLAGAFWPVYGSAIFAGYVDGDLTFLHLDYSRESKVTAWSMWTVAGISSIDAESIVASGNKLWFRTGTTLCYFDATATDFIDDNDPAQTPYESAFTTHFNDFGTPGREAKMPTFDLAQDGYCDTTWQVSPYGSSDTEAVGPSVSGPRVEGHSFGKARRPLGLRGSGVAVRISTRDKRSFAGTPLGSRVGWTFHRLSIDLIPVNR